MFKKRLISGLLIFTLIAAMFNIIHVKAAGTVDFGPYLYDLQSDSVFVMAVASTPDETFTVTLKDEAGSVINTFETSSRFFNTMNNYSYPVRYSYKLQLSSLTPNTTYKYDVNLCGNTYNNNTFKTPPVVGDQSTPIKFGVWGDTQDIPLGTRAAAQIAEINPQVMLHVGDLVNNGKVPSQINSYLFGPAANLLRNAAIIPSGGNHDRGASYWQELFPLPRTNTSEKAGNLYYTYDIGDVHFVVLHFYQGLNKEYDPLRLYCENKDPVYGDVARVKEMLEEDAASPSATAAKYRIVTMHAPPGSIDGQEWSMLQPYLKKYDPSMFFIGHKHIYNYSTLSGSEFKSIVTGLKWDGDSSYSNVSPSFIEATANYYDTASGKNTLRLVPHIWDGSDPSVTSTGRFNAISPILVNPPVINDSPAVETSDTTATITWDTDVVSDSRVEYGTDRYLTGGLVTQSDSSTSHSVTLQNLTPGTEYSYRVKGKGSNGDIGRTDILTFKTTGIAPPPTPTPSLTPRPTPVMPTPIPTAVPTPEPGEKLLSFANASQGTAVNKYTYSNGTPKTLFDQSTQNWTVYGSNNLCNDKPSDDAYVTYKFEGTKVKLYAETGPHCGIAGISVLDENNNVEIAEQIVDFYGNKATDQNLVYVSGDLPEGVHNLKVRVTGTRNQFNFSTTWTLNLYKIGVLGGPTPSPKPTSTAITTATPSPAPTTTAPTATASATPTMTAPGFTDLAGFEWAEQYINSLAYDGIINGYFDRTFGPGNNITRGEFAKLLTVSFGIYDSAAVSQFTDVSADSWYNSYIASLEKEDLTKGNGDRTFSPDSDITREEMFAFNARAMAKYNGQTILSDDSEETAEILSGFIDGDSVSAWARGFVATNVKLEIVKGSPSNEGMALNPGNPIIRAEVAVVLYKTNNQL